jgi:hypothetical protein
MVAGSNGDGLKKNIDHLLRYYPRPEEGEEIPIQFIDFENKIAGWSPDLKRTMYVREHEETYELKRVREVTILKVYNWLSDSESIIELSKPELMQFEETMDEFIKQGGEILYTRKKIDGKMINFFRLRENTSLCVNVKESLLVDKL